MPNTLTDHQFYVLDRLAWGVQHFGGLCAGGAIRRRDLLGAMKRGHAVSQGLVALCDDDGWTIEPERYREAFGLTDAGRAALEAAQPAPPGEGRES